MKLKDTFKSLRKEAGITQKELAKRAGVGLRFVRDVEQGRETMRIDKINSVLRLFGYHLEAVRDERA